MAFVEEEYSSQQKIISDLKLATVMFQPIASSLSLDIPAILKYGLIGLGAILAVLTFWLLIAEQKKEPPRKAMLIAIYVFMGFSILVLAFGLMSRVDLTAIVKGYVVPEQKATIVDTLPEETLGNYTLFKDISIFDLRGWKPVSSDEANQKISPANYINYLHIKKTRDVDSIIIHYATSGYGIDLRCITHNYNIYQVDTTAPNHKGGKQYGIAIDVSNTPMNEEFLVVVEATYWNGFKNADIETAMTYTDQEITGLNDLVLIVLLPYDKPVKSVDKFSGSEEQFSQYRGLDKFYTDQNGRFVFWNIKNIEPDKHYKLEWKW